LSTEIPNISLRKKKPKRGGGEKIPMKLCEKSKRAASELKIVEN